MFYVNYEHAQQFEVIFYTNIVFLRAIFSYSATYGPIFMKLFMIVNSYLTHVFTNFCKFSRFGLGFIGFWLYVTRLPF